MLLKSTLANEFQNRKMKNAIVERYVRDMKNGNWHSDTAETIKIAPDGTLIDGQHRLTAVVLSKHSQYFWVARGVPKAMFQYCDQGNSRTLSDLMSIEGWKDHSTVSVTGKMIWRMEKTKAMGKVPDPFAHAGHFNEGDGSILDWIKNLTPDLRESWEEGKKVVRRANLEGNKSTVASMLFYLWYVWGNEDADTRDLFFESLANPFDPPTHLAMAYCREYAKELNQLKSDHKLAQTKGRHNDLKEQQLAAYLYAWGVVRAGKRSRTYSGFKSGLHKDSQIEIRQVQLVI